ncbi:MAG: hypothetical protein BWY84_01050 [Candidatus Aerophobetes bacterium ADurb.Bin490]|nr:MAG: hypothetical protein BWY84_01050 [Candidatus Aerophobetes bacterium ADurb.Bin490]
MELFERSTPSPSMKVSIRLLKAPPIFPGNFENILCNKFTVGSFFQIRSTLTVKMPIKTAPPSTAKIVTASFVPNTLPNISTEIGSVTVLSTK